MGQVAPDIVEQGRGLVGRLKNISGMCLRNPKTVNISIV